MTRYGELVGDPADYNPGRDAGGVTTDGLDPEASLEVLDRGDDRPDQDPHDAAAKVRAWLDRHGVPLEAVRVYEHPRYGTIQVEKTGWIDDLEAFTELMRETEGIGYDGGVNYCRPEWVAGLPPAIRHREG